MDFCKEFNARTANYITGTPVPARVRPPPLPLPHPTHLLTLHLQVTVRPDRSFHFEIRTPPTASLLLSAAGVSPIKNKLRGAGNTAGPKSKSGLSGTGKGVSTAGNSALGTVGKVSLKHVYEIAKIKQSETRLSGVGLEAMVRSVVATAGSMGVVVEA